MLELSVQCCDLNPRHGQWWRIYIVFVLITIKLNASEAQTCFEPCRTCGQTNTCTSCVDGYYLYNSKYCMSCSYFNCLTCADASTCTSCKSGYYGGTCANPCGIGCKNNTCSYGTGNCPCKDGYWGDSCSHTCSKYCSDLCDNSMGSCQCKPGYYGERCLSKCISACLECDSLFDCTLCPTNKYGYMCGQGCSQNCSTGCNLHDGHCYNCYTGWFGIYCNNSCSVRCANGCDSTGKCLGCVLGYYGDFCNELCPSNCKGGCNQTTGECFDCVTGFEGLFCKDLKCPVQCESCLNKTYCISCNTGYYGEHCHLQCPRSCRRTVCNVYTGACHECTNTTLYGLGCNMSCSLNCKDNICNQTTRACIECTTNSMFGDICSDKCSTKCLNSACDRGTGQCTQGCAMDNYGPKCDQMCPMTCARRNSSSPNRCSVDGLCLEGCVDGYTGQTCANKVVVSPTASLSGVGIAGWVIACVLVLVVMIGIVVYCRRRSMLEQDVNKNPDGTENSYYNMESMKDAVSNSRTPDSTPDYSCLGDADISHTYSAMDSNAV